MEVRRRRGLRSLIKGEGEGLRDGQDVDQAQALLVRGSGTPHQNEDTGDGKCESVCMLEAEQKYGNRETHAESLPLPDWTSTPHPFDR